MTDLNDPKTLYNLKRFPSHLVLAMVDVETTGLRPHPEFNDEDKKRLLMGQMPQDKPLPAHRVIEVAVRLYGIEDGCRLVPTVKMVRVPGTTDTVPMHEYRAKLTLSSEDYAIAEDDYTSQRTKIRWRDVNGYTPEKWSDALPADQHQRAWKTVSDLTWGARIASSNPAFDRDFMEAEMIRHGAKRGWQRRLYEIQSLLASIGYARRYEESTGLHNIYDLIGGPALPEHSAIPDIERGKYVIEHALEAYQRGIGDGDMRPKTITDSSGGVI